jgi:hypothetical protein
VTLLGSDGWTTLIGSVSQPIGITCVNQEGVMVDPKGSKGAPAAASAGVQARNTIVVAMEDLVEADRK